MIICRLARNFENASGHGLGPALYQLTKAQIRLGHKIHVVTSAPGRARNNDIGDGLFLHEVGGPYSVRSVAKVAEVSRRFGVDIIHAHASSGLSLALLNGLITDKPYVAHVHGTQGYMLRNRSLTETIRGTIAFLRHLAISQAADRILVPSKAVARWIQKSFKISGNKIRVVYNGVDSGVFSPYHDPHTLKESMGLSSKKVVLYVGRLARIKGLETLIESIPEIIKYAPDVVFFLVGTVANNAYALSLAEKAKRLAVNSHLVIKSWIDYEQLPNYYRLCDVFVLPSMSEGLSKAMLEAMACGKPVVASNVGGTPEAVETGREGFLVPPADPASLAAAITTILSDHELASRMGQAALAKVRSRFTWRQVAHQIQAVYSEVVRMRS